MLLTYGLLIEGWRRVLAGLGGTLSPADAARIWFVANLAKWMPGAFWQLGALTELTRRQGVPVAVSTGSAVIVTIVNLFTGLLVAAAFALPTLRAGFEAKGWLIVGIGAAALALAPVVVPRLGVLARRLSGRELVLPRFTLGAVLVAGASTAIAWLAYGVAFWLMARAVLPGDERNLAGCIAIYTLSYLTGLFNPAPGGLGVAESAMVMLAPQLGVATHAEALVLSVVVRLWRTVLEVVPGVGVMVVGSRESDS